MDQRAEARRSGPQRRLPVARQDQREIGIPLGKLDDGAMQARLVEAVDQTIVPRSVKPAAGSGSNGRPSAPRSQARTFSPSDGRW